MMGLASTGIGPAAGLAEAASGPWWSPQWHLAATQRPQLAAGVQVRRHVVRGEVWHTLASADGRASVRMTPAAWAWIGRSDGRRSVQALWDSATARPHGPCGEPWPTQDEALQVLVQLQRAGLLTQADDGLAAGPLAPAGSPDAAEADRRRRSPDDDGPAAPPRSVWHWRIPLGSPDAWLARWAPRLRWAFGMPALLALGLLWLVAGVAAAGDLPRLFGWLDPQSATPRRLAAMALVAPFIKVLHEMAHGLVARHHGVRVDGWGIALMLGMPVPYVDAGAAGTLPGRGARMAVAGAGIALELTLAALAVAAALLLAPGPAQDAALAVLAVTLLGTFGVNANPLMRFDGYHLLTDAFGLPNLGTRSQAVWRRLGARLLGQQVAGGWHRAPGEGPWLLAYAPAAWAMRTAVMVGAVLWLGAVSPVLGWAAAAAALAQGVLRPLLALVRWLRDEVPRERRPRALRRLAAGSLPAVVLLAWPAPDTVVAQGVLDLPERATLRADADGTLQKLLVRDGDPVAAGAPVLRLTHPDWAVQREQALDRMRALETQRLAALRSDPAAAASAVHAWQAAAAEVAALDERMDQLELRAPAAGRLALDQPEDWPGRPVQRGQVVGHLLGAAAPVVRLAVPQRDAARLEGWLGPVTLLRARGGAPLQGRFDGTSSGAGARLPSAALATAAGGDVDTDPADKEHLTPSEAVLVGEVLLVGVDAEPARWADRQAPWLGERVAVRFDLGRAPLAWQGLRRVQQSLLRHFAPAA